MEKTATQAMAESPLQISDLGMTTAGDYPVPPELHETWDTLRKCLRVVDEGFISRAERIRHSGISGEDMSREIHRFQRDLHNARRPIVQQMTELWGEFGMAPMVIRTPNPAS